jgi:hypothetical protein
MTSRFTTSDDRPVGATPHLITLFLQLSVFWLACFIYERDAFFYGMSAVGAIVLTLKWQGSSSTAMPRWLSTTLWVPTGCFLLLITFVAMRHWLRA